MKKEYANNAWINPRVHFELRLSDVNRINELIDRDEPKAIVRKEFKHFEGHYELCPACGKEMLLDAETNFCRRCGQHLDTKNIAL